MTRLPLVTAAVLLLACASFATADDALKMELGGVDAAAMAATVEYTQDEGKTWIAQQPEAVDVDKPLSARLTFTVDDPAAVAMLYVAFEDEKNLAAFILGNLEQARGKNCGALPLWTYATATLNGKPVDGPLEPMMHHALPIVPTGALVKGENTIVVSGLPAGWGYSTQVPTRPVRLLAAAPQKAEIRSGPVLGAFGEDYIHITCRTSAPARVTIEATATEPKAAPASVTSEPGLYHRLKVPLPRGTRRFSYTATSQAGEFTAGKGPFDAVLPDPAGFRFIAVGNTKCSRGNETLSPYIIKQELAARPDLFVHLGQVVDMGSWDFHWDPYYFDKYAELLATVPTYLVPDGGDHVGIVYKMFTTPAGPDASLMNWTQVIGDVRLIGIDGIWDWSEGSENIRWLEGVLKESDEKFVIVFNHFLGYGSGMMAKIQWAPLLQSRGVILPLLAKHNVTAMVSAFDFDYERCEVPAPDGVPCIIAGAGGSKRLNPSPTATRNNPYSGTGPFVYNHSFAVFEVKGDALELKAYDIEGKEVDTRAFTPRKR